MTTLFIQGGHFLCALCHSLGGGDCILYHPYLRVFTIWRRNLDHFQRVIFRLWIPIVLGFSQNLELGKLSLGFIQKQSIFFALED
jgi:hypothetical protein